MSSTTLNKVASITLVFWIMKIVATTLGETLGDLLSMTLELGYALSLALTLAFFLIVVYIQLSVTTYIPFVYWLVIVSTTTLGTEISDFIDRSLHLGYTLGTLVLLSGLGLTLLRWYRKYGQLDVFPITDRPKEMYYWIAILFSNSLGTAFGDFLGDYFGLSYLQGAYITGGVILVVVLVHYLTKINHNLLFWIAFIFTRPFGATFGDFLTKPKAAGGLNLGTLPSTLVSVAILGLFLIFLHTNKGPRTERSS